MSIERAVKPVLYEHHLGSAAWLALHVAAKQRGRRPEAQAIEWLRFAAFQHRRGVDVELSQAQLRELLAAEESEAVA